MLALGIGGGVGGCAPRRRQTGPVRDAPARQRGVVHVHSLRLCLRLCLCFVPRVCCVVKVAPARTKCNKTHTQHTQTKQSQSKTKMERAVAAVGVALGAACAYYGRKAAASQEVGFSPAPTAHVATELYAQDETWDGVERGDAVHQRVVVKFGNAGAGVMHVHALALCTEHAAGRKCFGTFGEAVGVTSASEQDVLGRFSPPRAWAPQTLVRAAVFYAWAGPWGKYWEPPPFAHTERWGADFVAAVRARALFLEVTYSKTEEGDKRVAKLALA